jgi:hypothetical protein
MGSYCRIGYFERHVARLNNQSRKYAMLTGRKILCHWFCGCSPEFGGTAGPFLRFQGGTGPGDTSWTGSILFLTRGSGGTYGGAAPAPQPALTLHDSHAGSGAAGKQELAATQLAGVLGWAFWRFELELQLAPWQRPLEYSVSVGGTAVKTHTFWLPAVGQPMHWWALV